MDVWIGPAILAALISGLTSLLVVRLNFGQSRRMDQLRRLERIRDFQIALRAEVRSELKNLARYDLTAHLSEIERRYEESGFSVTVPPVAKHLVFDAIIGEIHILPEEVIDPLVLYARQRQAVDALVSAMRDDSFKSLSKETQLAMYRDYIELWRTWRDLAAEAEAALSAGGSITGTRAS